MQKICFSPSAELITTSAQNGFPLFSQYKTSFYSTKTYLQSPSPTMPSLTLSVPVTLASFPHAYQSLPDHQLNISSSTSSQNIYHFLWEAIHYLPNQVLLHMVSTRNATYHPAIALDIVWNILLFTWLLDNIFLTDILQIHKGKKKCVLLLSKSSLVSSIMPDTK